MSLFVGFSVGFVFGILVGVLVVAPGRWFDPSRYKRL